MKINKNIIKELTEYLNEFNLTEIEYTEKDIKVKVSKSTNTNIATVKEVKSEIKSNTKLISIMYVNNELGTINPISEIGDIALENKILFHSDTVQFIGKEKLGPFKSIVVLGLKITSSKATL